MLKKYCQVGILLLLFMGTMGCGNDNATGPEVGDPPALPDLEVIEPDVSYFQNNNLKQKTNANDNYFAAQQVVIGGAYSLALSSMHGGYMSQAETTDAEYDDGVWIWSYSSSFEGLTAEFRITAEELSNGAVQWAMYWSFDNGEESVDNYKMFEGTVSADGSSGNWTFNTLQTETNQELPLVTSDWTVSSDTEKQLSTKLYTDGQVDSQIVYEEDQPEFKMTISGQNQDDTTVISWNTDTNIGSITEEGTTRCWDDNFEDVPCN